MKKPKYYVIGCSYMPSPEHSGSIAFCTRKAAETWLKRYGIRNGYVYALFPVYKFNKTWAQGYFRLFSVQLSDGDLIDCSSKSWFYKGRNRYRNN